jgi:MSHA biogenesis protein MshM
LNPKPFPYRDFVRVHDALQTALLKAEEPYVLLTGETGTGKTALLRQLRQELDRARFRVCYFAEAKRLKAPGLVRVLGETLRVPTSVCHAVTFDRLFRALKDQSHQVLLWIDEAHDLPEETFGEARALAESDLDRLGCVTVLLAGMPRLAQELQAKPHLWRRIAVREELTGLQRDEMPAFVEHHFGAAAAKQLGERGLAALFEHGKGSPGLLCPVIHKILALAQGKAAIDSEQIDEALQRIDLT